ncbi:purine nucleoside phosphorylase-like isoform X1 [Haliotis rufescens]|uniref:purine nucleoside phosphorylase-like isoform X1 n=1 Tax=Haliotis rufescens TaxID=6454 RepID=UPI001EB055A8|nr:purine nucleoside phosphorylase-like isoform X1 [Haliotis rufescens]
MSVPAVGGTDPEGSRGLVSSYTYEDIQRISQAILTRTRHRPVLGIICGSGLGGLADMVEDSDTIPYSEIKDFPVSTVPGHMGYLVFGTLSGKPVVLMRGRFHYYEGYPMWKVAMPVRVMKQMGVKTLFVTNAAGGINPDYKAGDMMIIKDHIDLPGLTGECVLIGKNDDRFGPRFPATVDIYDSKLRSMAAEIGKELGYGDYMREGVYIMIGGPTFETVAESRLLRLYGADAVGMSTVPEAVVAKHGGIRTFGISLITDMCSLEYEETRATTHEEVLAMGELRAKDLQKLVTTMVERMEL